MITTKGGLLRSGPDDWTRQGHPYIVPCGRPAYLRQQVEMSLLTTSPVQDDPTRRRCDLPAQVIDRRKPEAAVAYLVMLHNHPGGERISPPDLQTIAEMARIHGPTAQLQGKQISMSVAAFFGRMIPVVRSLVSFAAGIARMRLIPFTVYTFLGSLPWTFLLVFAGMELGANWEEIGAVLKRFEYAILGILALAVVAFIWLRVIRPRRRRPA